MDRGGKTIRFTVALTSNLNLYQCNDQTDGQVIYSQMKLLLFLLCPTGTIIIVIYCILSPCTAPVLSMNRRAHNIISRVTSLPPSSLGSSVAEIGRLLAAQGSQNAPQSTLAQLLGPLADANGLFSSSVVRSQSVKNYCC